MFFLRANLGKKILTSVVVFFQTSDCFPMGRIIDSGCVELVTQLKNCTLWILGVVLVDFFFLLSPIIQQNVVKASRRSFQLKNHRNMHPSIQRAWRVSFCQQKYTGCNSKVWWSVAQSLKRTCPTYGAYLKMR